MRVYEFVVCGCECVGHVCAYADSVCECAVNLSLRL